MSGRTAWSLRLAGLSSAAAAVVVLSLVSLVSGLSGCGSRTGLQLDEEAVQPPDAAIPISPPKTPPACVQLPEPSIFMVSLNANLWQFTPALNGGTAALSEAGHLSCPITSTPFASNCSGGEPTPFSMAVDRMGTAYVVYCDGEVFEVNTQQLSCAATGLVVPVGFGMAFSQDTTDADETLFVAEGQSQETLASIDTTTLAIKMIGDFSPTAMFSELTGSGAGDLFAFYLDNASVMSIAKVDKTNAELTNILPLPGLQRGAGWAFVLWGGQFFTFTGALSPDGTTALESTVITRVSPVDGSQTTIASISDLIVGAGVSTCAPQQ